jgi:hypothetical protein
LYQPIICGGEGRVLCGIKVEVIERGSRAQYELDKFNPHIGDVPSQ